MKRKLFCVDAFDDNAPFASAREKKRNAGHVDYFVNGTPNLLSYVHVLYISPITLKYFRMVVVVVVVFSPPQSGREEEEAGARVDADCAVWFRLKHEEKKRSLVNGIYFAVQAVYTYFLLLLFFFQETNLHVNASSSSSSSE